MRRYSYKIRLYPNTSQEEFLAKQFGCCRFVYNYMLNLKRTEYKNGNKLSKFDLIKQLTTIKEDYPFLKDAHAWALQNAISNMDKAFINWFEHRANAPKFKSMKTK